MLLELITGYYASGGSDPAAMGRIEELRPLMEEQRDSVEKLFVLASIIHHLQFYLPEKWKQEN